MPGRGSYGHSGKWVHDRANHIMGKNPEMPKGMAYAIATQQGHKVGKSSKRHRTKEGVRVARAKHSLPKKMYKKTASAIQYEAFFDELDEIEKEAGLKFFTKLISPRTVRRHPRKRMEAHLADKAFNQQLERTGSASVPARDKAVVARRLESNKRRSVGLSPKPRFSNARTTPQFRGRVGEVIPFRKPPGRVDAVGAVAEAA